MPGEDSYEQVSMPLSQGPRYSSEMASTAGIMSSCNHSHSVLPANPVPYNLISKKISTIPTTSAAISSITSRGFLAFCHRARSFATIASPLQNILCLSISNVANGDISNWLFCGLWHLRHFLFRKRLAYFTMLTSTYKSALQDLFCFYPSNLSCRA